MATTTASTAAEPVTGRLGSPAGAWALPAVVLLTVLAAGLGVRLIGIDHGAPDMIFHPDVPKQALVARRIYHGNADIRTLYRDKTELTLYPYGAAVTVGRLSRLLGHQNPALTPHTPAALWNWALRLRYLAVFLGVGSVLVVTAVLAREQGPAVALLTGLLLVLEPLSVQFGHYGMNDVPLVALLLLAWLAARRIGSEPWKLPWPSLATGLLLGLAFGVKYQAALGGVFPIAAWLEGVGRRPWRWYARSVVALVVGGVAGVLATCPLLTSDPGYFFGHIGEFLRWQANISYEPIPLSVKLPRNLLGFAKYGLAPANGVLLAGLVGGAWLGWREWRRTGSSGGLLGAVAFVVLLAAVLIFSRDMVRHNDLLPVLGLLIVLYGLTLAACRRAMRPWGQRCAVILWVAGLVLLAVYANASIQDSLALARPETRVLARDWCYRRLPRGCSVLREGYTWPIGRPDIEERRVGRLLGPRHWNLIEKQDADYLVICSLSYERFFDPAHPLYLPDAKRRWARLEELYEPVATFQDRKLLFAQPDVKVLRRRALPE